MDKKAEEYGSLKALLTALRFQASEVYQASLGIETSDKSLAHLPKSLELVLVFLKLCEEDISQSDIVHSERNEVILNG